jgi:hypothetical protein
VSKAVLPCGLCNATGRIIQVSTATRRCPQCDGDCVVVVDGDARDHDLRLAALTLLRRLDDLCENAANVNPGELRAAAEPLRTLLGFEPKG